MKKIFKSRAYANTKIDYVKSQMQINSLLNINDIFEIQHTQQNNKSIIVFIKNLVVENKSVKVGVKIVIPDVEEKNKNQLYRALFHYLKSKFESLTFGFVEEYNEAFIKEFMPYVITDKKGNTIYDVVIPNLNKNLLMTESNEQFYLMDKPEDKDSKEDNNGIKSIDADYEVKE